MAAVDPYPYNTGTPTAPYRNAVSVAPSDAADLATTAYGLWVGGAGNVKVTTANGDTVTFNSVPAGTLLAVVATRVLATGTTATNIVAVW